MVTFGLWGEEVSPLSLLDISDKYDRSASYILFKKCWGNGEPDSCKNLHTSSFSSPNHLRTLLLDNHLTCECQRSSLWSASTSSGKAANKWEFNGQASTKFMMFTSFCRAECDFDFRSYDAKASLWMTMYEVHMGINLLYFILKVFRVFFQSCCPVSTDADTICIGNIVSCEIVVYCLEYVTSCTSLWKW